MNRETFGSEALAAAQSLSPCNLYSLMTTPPAASTTEKP